MNALPNTFLRLIMPILGSHNYFRMNTYKEVLKERTLTIFRVYT